MSQRFRKLTNSGGGGGGISEGAGTDISDNVIVRGDSGTDDVQGSAVTLSDAGDFLLPNISTPATPAAGSVKFYAKSDDIYQLDSAGVEVNLSTVSSGDVVGPASATDDGIAVFDTTTGKLLQNSNVTLVNQTIAAVTGDLTLSTTAVDSSVIINTTGTGIHYFSNANNQQAQINNAGTFEQAGTNGYRMIGVTSHDGVTPSFIPDKADPNTGFGHGTAADTTSVIAGGVEAIRSTATATTIAGQANVDNLRLDGNVISSTDANGHVDIDPNGTGSTRLLSGEMYFSATGPGFKRASSSLIYTSASPSSTVPTPGIFASAIGTVSSDETSSRARISESLGFVCANDGQYCFSSTNQSSGSADTGIARVAAGVVRDTDGSTGIGARLTKILVEANTAGSGAPNLLAATESRTLLTNEGTTAQNYHTLPSAAAGLQFTFVVQDTDGIRIVANTGDTIQPGNVAASAAAGFIQNSTTGSAITLVAINNTEWMATSIIGTWSVDS